LRWFQKMPSFCSYKASFLSDASLNSEENLCLNLHYLKCNSGWIPVTFYLWNISSKIRLIFSLHIGNSLAHVPPFYGANVLVKSLSVFIAHCPEDFWEEISMRFYEINFWRRITAHSFVGFYKISQRITVDFCLTISQKIGSNFFNYFKAAFLHLT
jgi:hypothetical protein